MRRLFKKLGFIFLLLCLPAMGIIAQSSYKPIIYKAYINGDMKKWASVITILEKQNSQTDDEKLELISYYYGYTAFLIGKKEYETAQKMLKSGERLVDELIKSSPKNASAYAFKGSFLGFHIGLSKFKAIALGPESVHNVNRSLQIDPQNIQGNVDKGNTLFFAPRIFGGNKEEALKHFRKAVALIEKSGDTHQNWFYLNVLTLNAQAYQSLNQLAQAKSMYEKVLRVEPEYKWVKNELYPALLQKMKNEN